MLSLKSFRPARLSVSPTVHQWLLLSSGFSCLLLLVRILVTGSTAYIFLPWNLLLAFVPYWITWLMTRDVSIIENKTKLILSLLIWLLFFPNSFYIITDLFHLSHVTSAPRWFDLLLIFSFAWNGMVCGLISMRRVEVVITALKGNHYGLLFIFGVMWLSAFGIYIGRFLRFNSWDVLTDPFSLAAEITDMIIHPLENKYVWSMTICYAVFMTLLYCTVKKLTESFGHGK